MAQEIRTVVLIGAPESGKTTLARAVLGLLPPLSETDVAEVTVMASLVHLAGDGTPHTDRRPCAALRVDARKAALYGSGGRSMRPGAVSRAHRGLLLLDDLPSFGAKLAALSVILDNRAVSIERASATQLLPAAFQLVATARPCPCGWFGDAEAICTCTPTLVRRYQQRIPAALRDRIELHLDVPRVVYERITSAC